MGEMPVVGLVGLGLGGLVVGAFLNVVIVRLPDGDSLLGPSRCPECETPIRRRDAIPVLSWILLRGRCRSCGEPIPAGYPLVELANAVLWVGAGLRFGPSWALVPMLVLVSTLLAQSVIDLELYRLLDKITFPVLGASVVLIAAASALEGDPTRVGMAVLGGVAYGAFLGVPAFVMPRGMGLGDVKLALLLGLFLGWLHPVLILFSLIIACGLGIVVGLLVLVARRGKSEPFPFGPWLALGCVLALLFSDPLLDSYLIDIPAWL
ncbi:prepilin peptidase [Iamia sp. SCSIO 61187]|uniref:prepilin peptidase n=1 Tax=Iamia sp. SCSIO 61187 TaxID=2722752 RepID=UPI001C627C22|nr:A24 family peptidase [Iamia sp. SCSIO 61187]QYG93106.1 prepilin peptidase [Iamia sp. SCSIO 61187]